VESPAITLVIRVRPRSAALRVGPWRDGVLDVAVTRAATGGEATRAALEAVADLVGVPSSAVTLEAGARSRVKRLSIRGVTAEEARRRLATIPRQPAG
jgi:uncharacterized protein YggU (UPF0235/DUF167 family)